MAKKLILLQNILLSILLITGCSSSFSEIKGTLVEEQISTNNDNVMDRGPIKGGTIKLLSTSPDSLNPLLTNNIYVRDFLGMVYESMVKIDKKLNAYSQLAERWEVSGDGLTWTFYLRKDVTWHDTVPFSAEDVEFTCDTIMKLDGDCTYKKNLENISAFSAIDKYTFKLTLKSPNSFTPELMTFPIIPKHYFSGQDIKASSGNLNPIGTGPYKFLSYNGKDDIKLMFNNKWWGGKNIDMTLPNYPYIAEVQVQILDSGTDTIDAFYASGIDTAYISTADYIKYGGRQDITIKRYPGRNYEYLSFNMNKPATSDKAVRQAVAHAIDRVALINEILPGQAVISDVPAIPGTWINDFNTDVYPPNKEVAKELLLNNGWKKSNYGLYKYINGAYTDLKLELLVNSDDSKRLRVAAYIVSQLNEIGINIKIKKVDWDAQQKLLASKTYDMALLGCYAPAVPDLSFMYASGNNSRVGDNAYNVSGFNNSLVDGYLGEIKTENGSIERKSAFNSLKSIVVDELPYYGLYFYNEAMLYNKRIRGEINPDIFNKYNNITKWYLP